MSEELEVLKLLSQHLRTAGIPFMVTGSMALNYYTVPRMTCDIDLVVELREADVERLVAALGPDWHADREEILDAGRRPGMFNVIHYPTGVKVDMVVRKNEPYREAEFARRRPVQVAGIEVMMVAPEDLLPSNPRGVEVSRDTSQAMDRRYREMLLARSGEERFLMGCSMYATARQLVEAGLRGLDPTVTESDLRVGVFRRFYGRDLSAEKMDRVIRGMLRAEP